MSHKTLREAPWYLVYDLEATCDDSSPREVPKYEMETIEIGAVLVSGETLQPVEEFQSFIRPVRHPVLTPFCTRLTSITQADVDAAPTFPEVFSAFTAWAGKYPGCLWSSWGAFDGRQLKQDSAFWGMDPPEVEFYNFKEAFANHLRIKQCGIPGALAILGLGRMTGTHHRGIDDARNIARVLTALAGRKP